MQHFSVNNGSIERIFEISEQGVRTVSLKNLNNGFEYIRNPIREFAFAIDDRLFTSYGENRIREVDGNLEKAGVIPVFSNRTAK